MQNKVSGRQLWMLHKLGEASVSFPGWVCATIRQMLDEQVIVIDHTYVEMNKSWQADFMWSH